MKRNNPAYVIVLFLTSFFIGFSIVKAEEVTVYDIDCFYKPTNRKCDDDELFGANCKSAKNLHIIRKDEGTGAQSDYSLDFYHFKEYEQTGNDQAKAKDEREWPVRPGPYEEENNYFGFGSGSSARCPNTVYISNPDWWVCGYVDLDTGIPCSSANFSYYFHDKNEVGSNYYIEYTLEYANYGDHSEEQNNYGDALPVDCGEYKYCYTNLELCVESSYSFNVVLPGGNKNTVELEKAKITGQGKEWNGRGAVQPFGGALNEFLSNTDNCPPYIFTDQYNSDSGRWLYGYNLEVGVNSLASNKRDEMLICAKSEDLKSEIENLCTPVPDVGDLPSGDPMTCESLKNTDTYKIVREVFKWIQIIAPIMLIIFGVMDFIKPVISSDNDAIKKAQSAFVKRLIVVAAIILLPFILDFFLSLLDGAMGNNISSCEIGK